VRIAAQPAARAIIPRVLSSASEAASTKARAYIRGWRDLGRNTRRQGGSRKPGRVIEAASYSVAALANVNCRRTLSCFVASTPRHCVPANDALDSCVSRPRSPGTAAAPRWGSCSIRRGDARRNAERSEFVRPVRRAIRGGIAHGSRRAVLEHGFLASSLRRFPSGSRSSGRRAFRLANSSGLACIEISGAIAAGEEDWARSWFSPKHIVRICKATDSYPWAWIPIPILPMRIAFILVVIPRSFSPRSGNNPRFADAVTLQKDSVPA